MNTHRGRLHLYTAAIIRAPTCAISFRAREMLGATLISIHNIHTLVNLARTLRAAILQGTFDQTAAALLESIPLSERNSA